MQLATNFQYILFPKGNKCSLWKELHERQVLTALEVSSKVN